jgi:signal transduction histidine kinase
MTNVFRSLRLKIFLMFIGSVIALHLVNLFLMTNIGRDELRDIYIEKIAAINIRWNNDIVERTEDDLRQEIVSALEIKDEKNIKVFLVPFNDQLSTAGNQTFLPRTEPAEFVERLPLTINFPLLASAMVDFQGQQWVTTRMIGHDGVILTMLSTQIINQRMDDFLGFRSRALKRIYPFTFILVLIAAFLISYAFIPPIHRIRETLRSVNAQELSRRIPSGSEDREFSELISVFNTLLERLERGFFQASRFSSDVAHTIRGPLASMQGYLERIISSAKLDAELKIQLRLVADEIERLGSITQKLLLLAQAEAGHLQLNIQKCNVSDMLNEIRSDFSLIDSDIELRGSIEKNLFLETDPALFRQMLNNLFSNAMKYNLPQGWMDISAGIKGSMIEITFSNPCFPLPDNFSDTAFERFYRGDTAHSRKIDGTGLGLSLCREIAIASNGQLEFSVIHQNKVTVIFRAPSTRITM